MAIVGGIDEAGRGPVIGPLVMAVCTCDESDIEKLEALGVKDSKLVLPLKRKQLVPQIKKICKHEVIVLEPKVIDQAVLDKKYNLNWLEADTSVRLMKKIKADRFYIDCPSSNPEKYSKYVQDKYGGNAMLYIEHKADAKYVIASAASIIAKVTRDELIEQIQKKHNIRFGSGYPADPETQSFLVRNWNNKSYSDIFRKSWASYSKLENKKKQMRLDGF